ncbi:MAG: 2-succinyl-5-enolpyruvyl-6-hydroxy-3-cyclohexene-1-carboxylic-acid synthase, partial [Ignavibacteriaceae bacterium]|nr:2-succinyl-5-enolpyruvyl-6-hydroxy-3-cyclohexene-1-carboxylic-acid synthase [Ignavibacteriaceae bacterium]
MKINVNRNNLWSRIFIDQLAVMRVQHACISPGSRSTPLTYILSKNRKIKSFIHIDERSSAFFALGLAKVTGKPVLVITTSGTAVAELYPAIIEAYQQRTPLIICTADRPAELIGTGANQTINQHNIFRNHIRWFRDLGLPSISDTGFYHLQKIAIKAYRISSSENRGPVHLNFPFKKPLEPFSYTDSVSKNIFRTKPQRLIRTNSQISTPKLEKSKDFKRIVSQLTESEKGIILVGPMEYDDKLIKKIKELSGLLKYPVFADGISQLRFSVNKKDNFLISNFNSMFASQKFISEHNPDIILQFGRTPTSTIMEKFLEETDSVRYTIDTYGDKHDPARTANLIFAIKPVSFCETLISQLREENFKRPKSNWSKDFIRAEEISENLKSKIIDRAKFPNEPSIITEILKLIPSGSNLVIGNSLPVRDLDNFAFKSSKKIKIHFNRGASGIDGITSTALGIASIKKKTFLITGDLSFLHDLNALAAAVKYSIPITILVINNNGGGIFESLPIANRVKHFDKFFITPHNLDLGEIIKSFGIDHQLITTRKELQRHLKNSLNLNIPSVLEIQTDAVRSVELRIKISSETKKNLDKE